MSKNFNKIKREIERIYKSTDWQLKHVNKACSSGCSHCCHQNIPVHEVEELTIADYIDREFSVEQKSEVGYRLRAWFRFMNEHTPNTFALSLRDVQQFSMELVRHRVPCPFLSDHKCSIYPVRPMTCRTFYVSEAPEKCEADPGRHGEENGYRHARLGFHEISRAADYMKMRILPYAVAERFGVLDEIKKGIGSEIVTTLVKRIA